MLHLTVTISGRRAGPDGQEAATVNAESHCSRSSGVNIANSVSTPTQTVLILVLPLIQTFTYPNLLAVIALKKNKVWMVLKKKNVPND